MLKAVIQRLIFNYHFYIDVYDSDHTGQISGDKTPNNLYFNIPVLFLYQIAPKTWQKLKTISYDHSRLQVAIVDMHLLAAQKVTQSS